MCQMFLQWPTPFLCNTQFVVTYIINHKMSEKNGKFKRQIIFDDLDRVGMPQSIHKACNRYTTRTGPIVAREDIIFIGQALKEKHKAITDPTNDDYIANKFERRRYEYRFICSLLIRKGYSEYIHQYVPLPLILEYYVKIKCDAAIQIGRDLLLPRLKRESIQIDMDYQKYVKLWVNQQLTNVNNV